MFDINKVSEIKVTYSPKIKASERPKITSPDMARDILRTSWKEGEMTFVESFKILLLNRNNKVLGVSVISQGGISGTVADPKVIFSTALKACSSNIILCHNHPSGNEKPSQADLNLTKKLVEASKLLDITILDHVILTEESFFSFANEGLI